MQVFDIQGLKYTYRGVIQKGQLMHLHVDYGQQKPTVGEVYLGRIQHHIPSQSAYFVDIGGEKPGYLQGRDISRHNLNKLRVGDAVVVQIKQEAHMQKGPKLTDKLSLRSDHIVLLTDDGRVHASGRIVDGRWQKAIISQMQEALAKQGIVYGAILRTQAYGLPLNRLLAEHTALLSLYSEWCKKRENALRAFKPHKLYAPKTDFQQGLENLLQGDQVTLLTNREVKAGLTKSDALPTVSGDCVFEDLQLMDHIRGLLKRSHSTKKGTTVVVDELEALTTFDVNASSFEAPSLLQGAHLDSALAINLDALPLILHLIVGRNVSGMIIVDFVKMDAQRQAHLLLVFKQAINDFSHAYGFEVNLEIKGFTRLGLLELVRPRTHGSLKNTLATNSYIRGDLELEPGFLVDAALLNLRAQIWDHDIWVMEANQDVAHYLLSLRASGELRNFFSAYMPTLMLIVNQGPINSLHTYALDQYEFEKKQQSMQGKSVDFIRLL